MTDAHMFADWPAVTLAEHEAAYHPGRPCPEDEQGRCAARFPRPVPSPEDRMRHATDTGPSFARPVGFASDIEQDERDALTTPTGRSFRTWMSDTDRDQLDARAACAEQERDDALDDRDQARAEAANLRKQLDAINTDRQRLQTELDTMTQVAQGNKRHVAYLTAVIEAINALHQPFTRVGEQWCTECSQRDGERFHFLAVWPCTTHKAIDLTVPPPSSVPPRRAQEQPGAVFQRIGQAFERAVEPYAEQVRRLAERAEG